MVNISKEPELLKHEADTYLENIKMYFSLWGKTFLIVSGTVWVTYKIIKGLSSQRQERKMQHNLHEEQYAVAPVKPSSGIAKMIKQQIALFLIAIIKQKLTEALSKRSANNEEKVV